MAKDELMSPQTLLILTVAHIEENLLLESDKKTSKNKLFTATEIREQMEDSIVAMLKALEKGNYDINRALQTKVFSKS